MIRDVAPAGPGIRAGRRHRPQRISPTTQDLIELGAVAVIRTFLNYFLEKDIEHAAEGVDLALPSATEAITSEPRPTLS